MSQSALIPEPDTASSKRISNTTINDRGIAMSEGFRETVIFLRQLIKNGAGIYLLTGETGVGKSTALRYCELQAPENVVVIIHSFRRIDVDNLSDLLGHTLGVKVPQELPPEARALRYFLKLGTIRSKGKRLILMLDDVQELHSSGAELLKALVNMKDGSGPLITVVLCGSSSLNDFLDKSYRWGIQRLIRENHEMLGFTAPEIPALVDTVTDTKGDPVQPLKASALQTLFNLSAGMPGKALELIEDGALIAERYHYQAISPRILKGADSGEFKTLPQVISQFAAKSVVAIALLLLVPITLFQQDWQQQQADRSPVSAVDTRLDAPPTESATQIAELALETIQSGFKEPVVASVADDIALSRPQSSVVAKPVKQVVAVLAPNTSNNLKIGTTFASFNQLVSPALVTSNADKTANVVSFNQSIPDNRETALRLLKQYALTIPTVTSR